jgi:hypothetical protein
MDGVAFPPNENRIFFHEDTIAFESISEKRRQSLKDEMPNLREDTLEDFVERNRTSIVLQNRFRRDPKVVLVKKKTMDEFLDEANGDDMLARQLFQKAFSYGLGIVKVSQVGFSDDGKQALLYGESWGGGGFSLFKWDGEHWRHLESGAQLVS